MRRLTILFLALCSSAFATTYYVDPQNTLGTSADTNNGTFKATAWVHAPGMTGCASLCASTTLNAGDSVIFRGGATIPSTYLPWTLPNRSGSSGSVIYYGVDPTWFVGGSFTRPIINGGNPLSTSFVGSCTVANSGTQVDIRSTVSFITFDNFEFTGFCWTGNVSSNGTMLSVDGGATNIIVSNSYFHGWTMTSGASDNFPSITTFGGGTVADNNQFTYDVFDGSDSPHFAAGTPISGSSPACQYSADGNSGITNVAETSGSVVTITTSVDLSAFSGGGVVQLGGLGVATWLNGLAPIVASSVTSSTVVFTDPTSHGTLGSQAETGVIGFAGCASGQGINGSHVYNVDHSIFRYLSNDIVTANCHSYHDNLFEYLYATFASGSQQQHPNVMNCIGGASGENLYWYNNTMRHTFATENVYFAVRTNLYYFNNVAYDNMNSVFGPASEASVCTRFNTVSNSTLPVNAYIYNNTDGDNSCQVKFEVANAPLTKWSGTGTFQNNHYGAQGSNCTGTCGTPLTGEYTCATSGTCTIVNNGTHVFQTTATETSQGYTSANMYQPTTGGSTISAGASAATQCAVFSFDSALCSGTSAGVSEQAGNGGQVAISPAVTVNLRGTTWDAGAYDFLTPVTPSSAGPVYPNGQLHPIQQVNIFNGPLNQTGAYSPPQWSDYKTALTSVLTTGGVGFINTGCTKASCTNLVFLDAGAGTDGADWCPAPSGLIPDSTNGLDGSSGWIATTTANGNLANLVIAPSSYGNNSVTPAGIFGTSGSPGWARKLDTNCSGTRGDNGGIYPLTWQPNHRYFPGQYVYDASTTAYWLVQTGCAVWTGTPLNGSISSGIAQVQLSGTPAGIAGGQYALIATSNPIFNAAYVLIGWDAVHQVLSYPVSTNSQSNVVLSGDVTGDAGCISGNALTFSGTSTPDGSAPNTFTWVKQADAPYQDSWVGSSYTGLANKAYSIPLASATDSCNGTTCTVTLSNAYIGTANVDHLTISGSNIAGINAANKLVTAIGATTVTYSNTTGSCNPSCSVTTGTLTASRNINMGMTNATIAVVQSGLPVPYEPPAYVANTYYCQWVFNHYAGNSKVGYIGCGGSIGGEDNTSGMTGTNGWRYGSEANYLGYQWQRLGLFHGYAKSANILLRGNIFLFTFQQAYADWAHSASLGTNGYQMNDALAILAGNCNVVGAVQADWCILFNEYYNLPYPDWFGTYPMLELQLGSQLNGGQGTSTPGLDNAGNTGSLGADPPPAGNANCVGCPFEGLMPLAKSLHATTMEIYDACDNFLAVDPAYPAGCSIVSGNVDVTSGVVTAHAAGGITFASVVAGNLVSIASTGCTSSTPCTVASVGASSFTLTDLTITGVTNVALKTWADPALYQIASAAAFCDFTHCGYQIAGAGTGSFVWGGTVAITSGPPNYPLTTVSTANPGTFSSPVASHSAAGTVYTGTGCGGGTGEDVCWVSGDKFSTFTGVGKPHISIGSPAVSYVISSVDVSGLHLLLTTSAGNQGTSSTGVAYNMYQSCIGEGAGGSGCQNTTWFTSVNPASDPYTRITDGAALVQGQSVGSFTTSGADVTMSISANETYMASQQNGGDFAFFQLSTASGTVQVVNPGLTVIHGTALNPTMFRPFSFDYSNDNVFYGTHANALYQYTISNINTLPSVGTLVVDWVNQCPGIPASAFSPSGAGGTMIPSADSNFFSVFVGPQGTAVWVLAFDKRFGCSAVNFATGQYWAYNASCSPNCSTVPATGTLLTTGTSCWGANVSGGGGGIHDIQAPLSGGYILIGQDALHTWTQGLCAGNTSNDRITVWQAGTANTFYADNENNLTFGGFGSHSSIGFVSAFSPWFGGYTIRPIANVSAGYTTFFTPALSAQDVHWSKFFKPGDVDTFSWVGATDAMLAAAGSIYSPPYPQNLVLGLQTNVLNSPVKVFGPTYSCGPQGAVYAHCTGGGFDGFGAADSIGVVSPKGHFFCFATSHFLTQGLDNANLPRTDVDCILLQ